MKRILAILLAVAVVLGLTLTSSLPALGEDDTTPPSVAMVSPPSGFALQGGITFVASAIDSESGVNSVAFSIREDNGGAGLPIGYEDLPAIQDPATGNWTLWFDTLVVPDGYYVVPVKAIDNAGNENSINVPYSIRNWAVISLLPATPIYAGSTVPVKFSLRVAAAADPAQPFVYTEDLTIKIYATSDPGNILQTSVFGAGAQDYRINTSADEYVTDFNTSEVPMHYTVDVWRGNLRVGGFTFETVVAPTPCHFVGGGIIGTNNDPRVSFGMHLYDDLDLQNVLQVNWGGDSFKLTQLTMVQCADDPAINPRPPRAGCDTMHARGMGMYNGVDGYQAEWIFTDAGDPGKVDFAWIKITAPNGDTVMEVSGFLRFGNIQALNR